MSDESIVFRLYVAGELPNSRRARSNLERFCREHLEGRCRVDVVDVFEEPLRALADRVVLTPQLLVIHDGGSFVLAGDLEDTSSLLAVAANAEPD